MKTRGAGNPRRARSVPAEAMEIYLPALTFAKVVQAAAEFGVSVDELMDEAAEVILRIKAAELFEREFHEAKMEAWEGKGPSLQRYEFERMYRSPSWSKQASPNSPGHR